MPEFLEARACKAIAHKERNVIPKTCKPCRNRKKVFTEKKNRGEKLAAFLLWQEMVLPFTLLRRHIIKSKRGIKYFTTRMLETGDLNRIDSYGKLLMSPLF